MRTVSDGFREALHTYGRVLTAEVRIGSAVFSGSDIVSINVTVDGALLTSIMTCAEVELDGIGGEDVAAALVGAEAEIRFGVRGEDAAAYNFLDLGVFVIKEAEFRADTASVLLHCCDRMLYAMVPYTPVISFAESVTLKAYAQALAARLGLEFGTESFVNDAILLDGEKYDETYTFRDVLTELAQAAAGTVAIRDGKLVVLYPSNTGCTVSPDDLSELTVGERFGPVNAVVLSRSPQEDNIYRRDETAESWVEWRIENNQLMDSHREDFIDGIYNQLAGLSFQQVEFRSFGICVLEFGDLFSVEDLDGNVFSTILLSDDIAITQGLTETVAISAPAASQTDYAAASDSDRKLNRTILKVDKQEQRISALVTKTENEQNRLSGEVETLTRAVEATVTESQVQIMISREISGINRYRTAMGYTFDENGLRIQKENGDISNLLDDTGMYVTRENQPVLTANTDGVSAINLTARQYLTIGTNSRFEDYAGNRTACFFVGGN